MCEHRPRMFVGNFDFEYRLGSEPSRQLPASVIRINEELSSIWMGVAQDGDVMSVPTLSEDADWQPDKSPRIKQIVQPWSPELATADLELCPWGWTKELTRTACRFSNSNLVPSFGAVRNANSRRFSFQLEQRLQTGLSNAAEIRSMTDFERAIRQLGESQWVIKAEFSMSSRERVLGQGQTLSTSNANWLRKRLSNNQLAFLEPWVEKIEEAGMLFSIPQWQSGHPRRSPTFDGLTIQLTDSNGAYRGSRIVDGHEDWRECINVGLATAADLQQAGYHGPLGIDAMKYRSPDGTIRHRPLQDINARFTMGRIALGWRRFVKAGQFASWLHVRWTDDTARAQPEVECPERPICSSADWVKRMRQSLSQEIQLIVTSPSQIGGLTVRLGTLLVVAPTRQQLIDAEEKLISH